MRALAMWITLLEKSGAGRGSSVCKGPEAGGPKVLEELPGGQCARAELLRERQSKREKWAPGPHASCKSFGFFSVEMGSTAGT